MGIKIGDIVLRESYGKDVYFKVVAIDKEKGVACLKGLDIRLYADAPLYDLVKPGIGELASFRAKSTRQRIERMSKASRRQQLVRKDLERSKKKSNPDYLEVPGRILHLDGDQEYMELCQRTYLDLGLDVKAYYLPEEQQPKMILDLLRQFNPDILVVTGHDSYIKNPGKDGPGNYRNSKYFVESVVKARTYQPSKDDLVIFAGACQSWYQGILAAGANFASAPDRVMIHCLDPVFIVEKVAWTPVNRTISIFDVLTESITGVKGVGGIETRGQFRLGLPRTNRK